MTRGWKPHWQPKDRKEDMADDIRDWVRRTSDDSAGLPSLERMTYSDLTDLMLAVHRADKGEVHEKAQAQTGGGIDSQPSGDREGGSTGTLPSPGSVEQ